MSGPRSVRFDPVTDAKLASFAARHPGMSRSSAAAMLVEEGLRMDAHPGVLFRDGPTGRRAVLAGGPDVWEVVRAVTATRAADPHLGAEDLLAAVSENTGLTDRWLRIAIAYYADFPSEVDDRIAEADRAERDVAAAVERRSALLGA